MKKNIIISAVNLTSGGTLSILKDCLYYISTNKDLISRYNIIAIVHKKTLCDYPNIKYIELPWTKKNWLNRIYCEYIYFHKLSISLNPHLWLSLHDISPNVKAKIKAVYCHNPSMFYTPPIKDLFFNYKEFLFSKFYSYLYKINIKKNKYVIVQQDWIRKEFCAHFKLPLSNIIVSPPENCQIENKISITEKTDNYTFFYPSYPRSFKNFEIICEACKILNEQKIKNYNVILTISGNENKYSKSVFTKYKNQPNIIFKGLMTREEFFNTYSISDCLIFPSKLETWGLPISEFKSSNKPMILANLPYAYETSAGAEKILFFNPNDANELANKMKDLMENRILSFNSIPNISYSEPFAYSWDSLIKILLK